jgi:4-amino-4-deoxy-L-arabinose transferase-like glycosyltransferase
VTQIDNSSVLSAIPSPSARIAWTVLILATLYICYFHNLGAIGLVGPDEPRYAWIARDMAESGDWVTPRLYGKPWFEKPALYYWAAALSFKLFGVSEVAARLPSGFSALLATLAMAWLGWSVYGAETARWLLLLLPTTVGMIGFSHAATTDMPFTAMLTMAMVFAVKLLRLDPSASLISFTSSASFTSFFFGFFLGLAVLAKGPAAIVLSAGAVLLWAILTTRWRDAFRCIHPIAIVAFCLTALPWYILCAHRNPDFFRVFIVEHNFRRYVTPEFQHIQPFWFYIPILLLAVFPWTLVFIPAVRKLIDHRKAHSPDFALKLLLASWALFPIVFFSISRSKLPGYILPAIPAVVLLFAESISANMQKTGKPVRWPGLIFGSSLIALGLLSFLLRARTTGRLHAPTAATEILAHVALLAVLWGVIVFLFGLLRSNTVAVFATVLCLLFVVAQTDQLLGSLDAVLTARAPTVEARKLWPEFSASRAATWQVRRSFSYQLDFYTHAELPDWAPSQPKPNWLFVEPARKEDASALGFTCAYNTIRFAVIPCKKESSAAALDGLGGLVAGNGGNGTDRQPR